MQIAMNRTDEYSYYEGWLFLSDDDAVFNSISGSLGGF